MGRRKALCAVAFACLVAIGQAGCGGGSAPSAGSQVAGDSAAPSAVPAGPSAGPATGSSGPAGGTTATGDAPAGPVGSTAPAAVTGRGTAKLSWNPALEGAKGFKVYYGTASGSYSTTIDVGMAPGFTVSGLGPGTYYFAVTAYDLTGGESVYSNEVSKTIS